jgi:hypothetical protein
VDHHVLVFAMTGQDFTRMMRATFLGYPKPVLSIEGGLPVVKRKSSLTTFLMAWLRQRSEPLAALRFAQWWRSSAREVPRTDKAVMDLNEGQAVAAAMFSHLASSLAHRGGELVVVLLPTLDDYHANDGWRAFLEAELPKRRIPFVDLVAALKNEKEDVATSLFRGHYNERGNRWVVDHLYPFLIALPKLKARLNRIAETQLSRRAPPPESLEKISLEGAKVNTTALPDLGPLVVDGSLETRWHTAAAQRGVEAVVIDLAEAVSLRQVRLELGKHGHDFGRVLAIDVATETGQFSEVALELGEDSLTRDRRVQEVTLPTATRARQVRIRQLGRSEANFWSICEVDLLRERQ